LLCVNDADKLLLMQKINFVVIDPNAFI